MRVSVQQKIEELRVEYTRRRKDGWTRVIKKAIADKRQMEQWCSDNEIVFFRFGRIWMFEQEQDALYFSLRWA